MKKEKKLNLIFLGLIVLLVLLQGRFLLRSGFYTFSDEPHLANLYQMIRALGSGQFPPRWAPDMSFNFGYPFFNFYYPLPFYLGAFFYFAFGLSLIWSLKLTFLLGLILAGVAFYFLAKEFFNKTASFCATVVYLFTPYKALNLYGRGAIGEIWAFVFMPLLFWALIRLLKKVNLKNLVFTSLSLGGLVLSHNLTPIIFLPFIFLFSLAYLFWVVEKKKRGETFLFLVLAVIFGLSLSSYYWLPALIEKVYIQPGTPFNPRDHFPFIRQLVIPYWGYGASVWGPSDQISFQIGVVNLAAVFGAGLLFLKKKKELGKRVVWLVGSLGFLFGASVFMMNIRSWFIWDLVPISQYIQFPWRFLLLTTFASALLVAFLPKRLSITLAILSVVLTIGYFKPDKLLLVDDDYYLRRFFVNQSAAGRTEEPSEDYFNYSEDYLPLTIWTKERPAGLPEKVVIKEGEGELSFSKNNEIDFGIETKSEQEMLIAVNSYYFPGWVGEVDGQKIDLVAADPHGQIEFKLPSGEHSARVYWSESLARSLANKVSAFSLLLIIVLLFKDKLLSCKLAKCFKKDSTKNEK